MTKIFATYGDFQAREDKSLNGVSPEFAEDYPDWKEDNKTNRGCWNCANCRDCVECAWCYYCTECRNCFNYRYEQQEEGPTLEIPVIENIHQKVYKAASKPGALDMEEWHTCETTHCRAGWVVHLAGEAGYKLVDVVGYTDYAALLIYDASSPICVSEGSFYEDEEEALESMREAAEAEKRLNKENHD